MNVNALVEAFFVARFVIDKCTAANYNYIKRYISVNFRVKVFWSP